MSHRNGKSQVITVIAVVIGAVLGYMGVRGNRPMSDAAVNKELEKAASQFNQTLPKTIDEETRLDRVQAEPGRVLRYYSTLMNITKDEIDFNAALAEMRPTLISQLRSNPDAMKVFRDAKVTMHCQYSDKNGVYLGEIVVGPGDY